VHGEVLQQRSVRQLMFPEVLVETSSLVAAASSCKG